MRKGRGVDLLPTRLKGSVEHAIAQDESGKHVSGQAVRCSQEGCTASERIVTNNHHHRLPDTVLRKKFQQRGWRYKSGDWLCPEHAFPRKPKLEVVPSVFRLDPLPVPPVTPAPSTVVTKPIPSPEPIKEIAMPEPTPIRSFADLANAAIEKMGRADRQRIFREIDANWDGDRGRYLGNAGDQSIATQLNVPRAWVEHIRAEAFGDAADNEELEELAEAIKIIEGKIAVAETDAQKIVTRMTALYTEVRQLKERIEKARQATSGRRF